MANQVAFEEFLSSKMIDSDTFRSAEPEVWNAWRRDFEQMHPSSFTVQKLNLINVIRRKYLRSVKVEPKLSGSSPQAVTPSGAARPGKPVIKPRTS